MSLIIADRVKETTSVTGTGPATLLGAVTGFQSFSVVGNTNVTYYCIADQTGPNWEVGIGTYSTTGPTLTRTTILSSSNAGAAVTFTSGTKDIFVTYPAGRGMWLKADGTMDSNFHRTISNLSPTSGTTVFSLAYVVGYLDVYQNGIKLVNGDDYIATDGSSITLTIPTLTGDSIELIKYDAPTGPAVLGESTNSFLLMGA